MSNMEARSERTEQLKLTVLGSCGGYPEPGRACSGFLLQQGPTNIWIDAGAGTLDALTRILNLDDLEAVLLSHTHPDHWTDLPIALHRIAVTRGGKEYPSLAIYGPPEWPVSTGIARQWYSRDGSTYHPITLEDGQTFRIDRCDVNVATVEHGMPAFAMRFDDGDSVFVYSADTAPCPALVEIARGADLFLCESTLPPGQETPISMNPAQAGQIALDADVRRLVLTHLLPGIDPAESCRIAASVFGGPVSHAYPGTVFEIRGSG
jgi:ribonuclease BN (tRNA processing enzyme)